MEFSKKTENTLLFLKYVLEEGKFNPNDYMGILELGHAPEHSLSQFLSQYKQFLLSEKVRYNKLEEFGIEGANGYLEESGIFVPKSLYNDDNLLDNAPKVPYKRRGYSCPSIEEFDSILCEGISKDVVNVNCFDIVPYIGYCADLSDEKRLEVLRSFYNLVLEKISMESSTDYKVLKERDSQKGKEFYLIKRNLQR